MKSVLISIKPKWCELIASGKKTIEVRKTKPKLETPVKCYIYCTQGEPAIYVNGNKYVTDVFHILSPKARDGFEMASGFTKMNGKVIGEFICDEVGEAHCFQDVGYCSVYKEWKDTEDCLSNTEILEYMGEKDVVYGWHISDLKIYDEPKELSEFKGRKLVWRGNNHIHEYEELTRPPQSWCYVK